MSIIFHFFPSFHKGLKVQLFFHSNISQSKVETLGHYLFPDNACIRLPFLLSRFFIPMIIPEVLIWLENRVHLHVHRGIVRKAAVIVMTLENCVILHGYSIRWPVFQTHWLDRAQPWERASLELDYWLVVRSCSFWKDKKRCAACLLVLLLSCFNRLAHGNFFLFGASSI